MGIFATLDDRRDNRDWRSGAMDLDAVAAVFRRNMTALVTERGASRQTGTPRSHIRAA